jgi:hypothetical protein
MTLWSGNRATSPSGEWCGRRDSNPHAVKHEILNLACLPVSSLPRRKENIIMIFLKNL